MTATVLLVVCISNGTAPESSTWRTWHSGGTVSSHTDAQHVPSWSKARSRVTAASGLETNRSFEAERWNGERAGFRVVSAASTWPVTATASAAMSAGDITSQ